MADANWLAEREAIVADIWRLEQSELGLTKKQERLLWDAYREIENACKHDRQVHRHYSTSSEDEYSHTSYWLNCDVVCLYHKYPVLREKSGSVVNGQGCTCLISGNQFYTATTEICVTLTTTDHSEYMVEWSEEYRMYMPVGPKVAAPPPPPPKPIYQDAVESYWSTRG